MGKRTAYAISISHNRPPFPDSVIFIKVQEIFTEAFKEEHPDWLIQKVVVAKE